MSENREGILADFQECTGIEDVGEAIFHLEEVNWDLLKAVNRVMPHDTQTLPSEMDVDVEMIEEIIRTPSADVCEIGADMMDLTPAPPLRVAKRISADVIPIPSTSQAHSSIQQSTSQAHSSIQQSTSQAHSSIQQLLHFNFVIRDRIIHYQLPDTLTIADLKILLAERLQILPCHQEIHGWPNVPTNDRVTLASLQLPKENTLSVVTPDVILDQEYTPAEANIVDRLSQNFTLNIHDQTNGKHYSLNFLGSKPVLEVKTDMYALTDIAVRHQVWSGWPEQLKSDKTTLACSGIQLVHDLTLKRSPVGAVPSKERKIIVDLADSDNSSVEEFEDASETFTAEDDIFVDVETKRMQSLIPDNTEDEASGCIHFAEEFANRYGHAHPDFFLGTLDDAIREACTKPAKDRRLLAVYLHHDASVLTNVFCTQLLCFESVLQCLASHFVVWGWDLTHESNKNRFLACVARSLGTMAAMTIRNIDVERLPAVLIIMKIRSATEIFTVVHGNVGVSELLTSLIQSVDVFTEQQRLEMREEDERSARELVKREQDEAYEESLETDRLKEEAKKQQTMMANKERERKESHKQVMDSIKEANRLEVEATLPSEPEEGAAGDGISKIRFRLPKGDFLTRRFHANTSLQILLNYLIVQGYPPDEFKVISSWPRRDLTSLDPNLTLQELKLYPQETVTLEER